MFITDFQTWIGQVDVKSSPVYFYVQRNNYFNTTVTPIPFDVERLNAGGAMNLSSGKFTAPRDGIYEFSFMGSAYFPASSSTATLRAFIYMNGNIIGKGQTYELSTAIQYETFSFQSTLNLKAGDQIWLEIYTISTGVQLEGGLYTAHFSGYI